MEQPNTTIPRQTDVLVVGGGPTGLTVANLLGTYGITTTVVERNHTTSDEAKAISLDDESLRTMQLAGLDRDIYPIIVPGTGTKYFAASGRPLVHARGPGGNWHGHPFKNAFSQPNLERVLASGLNRFAHVSLHFSTTLRGITPHPTQVHAIVSDATGAEFTLSARYVLGCDGGRSTVREALNIPMAGSTSAEQWLVVDALADHHDQRYGMHHGDPRRPHVIVPGRDGRCRYEFRVFPGEAQAGSPPPFELISRLIKPYRVIEPHHVERAVVYTFHALLAEHFRSDRCFLLGDAAHMMPPFAGQGLNSGIRDAANLCWKVAAVAAGDASAALLETYEQERRPHARAVIDLSTRLGSVVMTTSPRRAWLRDSLVRIAMRTRRGRRYLVEMRFRPKPRFHTGLVIEGMHSSEHAFVGTTVPQPLVLAGANCEVQRLDDILGTGSATIGVDVTQDDWREVERTNFTPLGGRRVDIRLGDRLPIPTPGNYVVADADGRLEKAFAPAKGAFLLVRPDRMVAAVASRAQLQALSRELARFAPAAGTLRATPESAPDRDRSATATPTPFRIPNEGAITCD